MSIRPFPSLLALSLMVACAPQSDPADEAVDATASQDALLAENAAAFAEAMRRIDEHAAGVDRILSPLPVMSAGQQAALRRHLNAAHVARARELGVRVGDREELQALVRDGTLVELEDSTEHWIVRPGTAPTHVTPHVPALLAELGERFQARLAERGLPPYRIEVTSALRTSDRQASLTRSNANAAALSSHEFGTTVDISYAAFAPPASFPDELFDGLPEPFVPLAHRVAQLALESVSGRKSREIGNMLAEVLVQAQSEGLVLVIYEEQQTVFHMTVGRALAQD